MRKIYIIVSLDPKTGKLVPGPLIADNETDAQGYANNQAALRRQTTWIIGANDPRDISNDV